MIHVIPLNDNLEHIFSVDCKCGPTLIESDNGLILTHHSFDGRELFEQAGILTDTKWGVFDYKGLLI